MMDVEKKLKKMYARAAKLDGIPAEDMTQEEIDFMIEFLYLMSLLAKEKGKDAEAFAEIREVAPTVLKKSKKK